MTIFGMQATCPALMGELETQRWPLTSLNHEPQGSLETVADRVQGAKSWGGSGLGVQGVELEVQAGNHTARAQGL